MRIVIIFLVLICIAFTGCTSKDVDDIRGTVFKDLDGNGGQDGGESGLGGVKVQSGTLETTTGSDGSFTLSGGKIVENGATIKLFFSKQGWNNRTKDVKIQSGDNNTLSPEEEKYTIDMQTNSN